MEAATVPSKKAVNKGKLKKTIKNILCRPDPLFWPLLNEEQKQLLVETLNKYKVEQPKFEKLHWNELKQIPKEKRPKQPPIKRLDGLLFGISECSNAIKSEQRAAVIIEASVNPRIIVQPLLEACIDSRIPVVCLSDLRMITSSNFHIPTSCLAIKTNTLTDLQKVVSELATNFKVPQKQIQPKVEESMDMILNEPVTNTKSESESEKTLFPYLHRTDKKSRVFVPSDQKGKVFSNIEQFKGQDFITFNEKSNGKMDRSSYMKMIVKRISNNPNRVKSKKKDIKKLV